MVSVDLYRAWPSVRRRASHGAADAGMAGRSTTLDRIPGQESRRKADPARVRDLLSQLITAIEGKPLSDFVPMAEAVPLLIGLTPGNLAAFDEFFGAFIGTVVGDLGRVVTPGSVTSPADSVSANRTFLAAKALGVKGAANVKRARPATARRFDDLMAMFSEGRTLAAVLGDGHDGLPPGTSEVVNSMLVAIRSNLKAGDDAGARQAGADAGVLMAAVHGAFFGGQTSERNTRSTRMRRIGKNHYAAPGWERRRKGRAMIKMVEIDGQDVPIQDAKIDVAARKFVRRRKRGR